jgi:hypothetical protein
LSKRAPALNNLAYALRAFLHDNPHDIFLAEPVAGIQGIRDVFFEIVLVGVPDSGHAPLRITGIALSLDGFGENQNFPVRHLPGCFDGKGESGNTGSEHKNIGFYFRHDMKCIRLSGSAAQSYICMVTFRGSVKKRMASQPPSLPTPEFFTPPKGVRKSRSIQVLIQIIPACSPEASRLARSRLLVHTVALSPYGLALAFSRASSSVSKGCIVTTGPNISS